MCDPVTAVTVASVIYSANQQRQQGRFQKGVADYNARVAENEAEKTRSAGVERENTQRRRTAELVSKQRAQLGASGVDLDSGSALQLQEDALIQGEADALRIRSNFGDRADALDTSSALTERQGEFAQSAGNSASVGTLLGAASSAVGQGVADKWFTPNSSAKQFTGINTGVNAQGAA